MTVHDSRADVAAAPLATNPTSRAGRRSRRARRSRLQLAVLAVPLVVLGWGAWIHRNIYEDGYIYLHVVQNILAGNGPVFNAGQRVEAYTSPLWTAVLAVVAGITRASLEWTAVVLGIVLTVGAVGVGIAGSARTFRCDPARRRTFLLPIGALVFVVVEPVWTYASAGLETGLCFAWLAWALYVMARWAARVRRPSVATLIVLGLGPLVRPELLLDSAVFIGALLLVEWARSTSAERLRVIAWAAALPVAYEIFRMGYFGALVPNTAIAKDAGSLHLGLGVQYLWDFLGPYFLVFPLVLLLLGAYAPLVVALRRLPEGRRWTTAVLALPVAGGLNAAYVVAIGGDYLHARLLLPAFFAVLVPVFVVPVTRRYGVSLAVLPWVLACGVLVRVPTGFRAEYLVVYEGNGNVTLAENGWPPGLVSAWYRGKGVYVQRFNGPGPTSTVRIRTRPAGGLPLPTIVTGGIGRESVYFGTSVHIVDFLGLADPLTAHLPPDPHGFTGHEEVLPTPWIIALVSAPGSSTAPFDEVARERYQPGSLRPAIPGATGRQLAVQTAWARAALSCPDLRAVEIAPSRPLTAGGFLANVFGSFGRTFMSVPADPRQAYRTYCGPGTPEWVRRAQSSP